jgi:hypothetical protein
MTFGFTACPGCGVILPRERASEHDCEHDKWVAYQVGCFRSEIERIDVELSSYLQTSRGRFEAWYAERTRLRVA